MQLRWYPINLFQKGGGGTGGNNYPPPQDI